MPSKKFSLLFTIIITLLTTIQSLNPISHCLAGCTTCEPFDISVCIGNNPCEWGYHDPHSNGICQILPSLHTISNDLGKPINKDKNKSKSNWGDEAKYSTCQYTTKTGKKTMEVLGMFNAMTMLQRVFDVSPNSQIFSLSFNLLRDEWLPFSDFLLIDISSEGNNLQSIEISYQTRVKAESQQTIILCGGKKIINQKYSIQIANNGRIGKQITVVFNSYLYSSIWGISNFKFNGGCQHFSMFQEKSNTCTKCDSDSYLYKGVNGGSWCQKCPKQCISCVSFEQCNVCSSEAVLQNGKCELSTRFNLQTTQFNESALCGSDKLLIGSLDRKIVIPQIRNENDELFDQIQLSFKLYYDPLDWTSQTSQNIKIKLNNAVISTLSAKNLSNKGIDHCKAFKNNRTSVITIYSSTLNLNDNTALIEFELTGKNNDLQFGVGDVSIRYLKKLIFVEAVSNKSEEIKQVQITGISKNIGNKNDENLIQTNQNIKNNELISLSSVQLQNVTKTQNILTNKTQQPTNPQLSNDINSEQQKLKLSTLKKQQILIPLPIQSTAMSSISYVPTTNGQSSGLQLLIKNIKDTKSSISILIDKIPQQDYQISSLIYQDNDMHILVQIRKSFINGVLTIFTTPNPSSTSARLLQTIISQPIASIAIDRYDSISPNQIQSITTFSYFFSIFAWMAVILIFIAVIVGQSIIVEDYVLALQLILFHVYIASQTFPLSFRDVISGLNILQNFNCFTPHQQIIAPQWTGNIIEHSPIRYTLLNSNFQFTYWFLPIIIINSIYFFSFGIILIAKKYLLKHNLIDQQKSTIHKMVDKITCRVINFIDQIWRYQFLSTIWLCLLHIINANNTSTFNSILCFSSLICTIAWPVYVILYCRKQYYQKQYSEYVYKFEGIYYGRIPQYLLPTNHHRIGYQLLRTIRILLFIVIIIFLKNNTTLLLLSLISLHALEIIYAQHNQIFSDQTYFKFKIIENVLFVILDLFLMLIWVCRASLSESSYVAAGFLLSAIALLIVINSLVRLCYLARKKYLQQCGVVFLEVADLDKKKLQTERIV